MEDYLKREDIIDRLEKVFLLQATTVRSVIDRIPAADVVPRELYQRALSDVVTLSVERKHGKWKPRDLTWGRNYYYCSACEETVDMPTAMGIPMFCYCPNCGADMRESEGE